jgi:hypothetical protein
MNSYSKLQTRPATLAALLLLVALASLCAAPVFAADKKAPPAKAASAYPANDVHPKEHVSIAIDPCDDPHDCPYLRLPYNAHGFIPVRVVITNDGETAITLDDARFQFISANNDKIPAANLEDLNRRLAAYHRNETKIPLIPITIHHTPIDKKIVQDDEDFGFKSNIVNAHSTLDGYLYYDIKDLDDPALKGAQFYVKMIHTLDQKNELFAFTIPFDKWLAQKPPPPPKPQPPARK